MRIENVKRATPLVLAAVAMTFLTGVSHANPTTSSPAATSAALDGDCKPKSLMDMLKKVCSADADVEVTGSVEKADPVSPAKAAEAGRKGRLRALIHQHAVAHGVPPDLAEAVVHVESRFNARARGSHGEVGLMQIKPATARGLGYRGTTAGLYDVETNLTWGMVYLARAYQLADGDTCGAILRYNGGHGAKRMTSGVRAYCSKVNRYVASL